MKTRHFLTAAIMLASAALTACADKKTDATQKTDTAENLGTLIEAAMYNDTAKAQRLIAAGAR